MPPADTTASKLHHYTPPPAQIVNYERTEMSADLLVAKMPQKKNLKESREGAGGDRPLES